MYMYVTLDTRRVISPGCLLQLGLSGRDHGDDGQLGTLPTAEPGAERMPPAHDDVAEHGDGDGQPDGHRVGRDAEVVVEDEVDDPAEMVSVVGRRACVAVEVAGIRAVAAYVPYVGYACSSMQENPP